MTRWRVFAPGKPAAIRSVSALGKKRHGFEALSCDLRSHVCHTMSHSVSAEFAWAPEKASWFCLP